MTTVLDISAGRVAVFCHPQHAEDGPPLQELLERIDGVIDLTEPFTRIREAIGEARKMGVTKGG